MVLKSSKTQLENIALIRDLEEQYGSLSNVPEDNKQLLNIRNKFEGTETRYSFEIPAIVLKDKGREPIRVPAKKSKMKPAYQTMLKNDLRLPEACRKTGVAIPTFRSFLNDYHAITRYYQMTFKGRKIRGKSANDVLNEAKKLGYRSTTKNAVANHDLHFRIVLAPLLFSEPAPLKSR